VLSIGPELRIKDKLYVGIKFVIDDLFHHEFREAIDTEFSIETRLGFSSFLRS